jgi:hypothetical protein
MCWRVLWQIIQQPIRRAVSILLDRDDSRIFLVRRNPKPPKTRDPDVYYAVGADLAMPLRADWTPNIGVSDIETILTSSVGISENVTTDPEGL